MNTPETGQTIAVTGATGYVGRFVVAELQKGGARVRALARDGSDKEGFDAPIDWVAGDLRSEDALRRLVDGADAVAHMAYEHAPGRFRGGEGDDLPAWLDANVMGSLRLLTLAAQAHVARFVFLSSRAVFSRTDPGRMLDETHPLSPDTHYGAYKAAVEAFLYSFERQHGMRTFGVRATGVYGLARPVERSKWWDLVVDALDGVDDASPRGGTEVYGGDVARVVWALLSRQDDEIDGLDIVHLSDLYVTGADVVRIARRFAGLPVQPPPQPPAPPASPLECRNLRALGIRLGGVTTLERTIEQLVEAAQRSRVSD